MVKGVAVARTKVRSTFVVNFMLADDMIVVCRGIWGGRNSHVAGTWKGSVKLNVEGRWVGVVFEGCQRWFICSTLSTLGS